MTDGICPNCGGLTSTPMYRCRCASDLPVVAASETAICEDGMCWPVDNRPLVEAGKLTRGQLEQLNDLLNEGAP